MKKKLLGILLCLVMVVGLLPTAVLAADEVAINETNFPDAKFRNYVQTEFDKNNDSKLSSEEIAAVKKIEANKMGIKSLDGVGFFTALETLKCWDNELTALDVSKNTKLTILSCSKNELTELDVSKNTELTRLHCGSNRLAALDVTQNKKLEELDCESDSLLSYMKLTKLDVSQNKALKELNCYGVKMKELNVSGCTALERLDCGGNQLDALDVSTNKNLIELRCSSNQLDALDVSKNLKLKDLSCRNNFLAALDVSQNLELKKIVCERSGLTSLDLDKNKKIDYIQLTEHQFYNKGTLPAGGTFDMNDLPGFDPQRAIDWQGGTMDTTTGILTVDADAVEVTYNYKTKSDSTEAKYLMPCKMQVQGGTTPPTTYTVSFDANGGTGTMAAATGVTSSYTLPACTFTAPSDKQFKGWATSASGTVITGTSITVSADTKLYAIWEPIPATEYTISFNINGGIGTIPSQTTSGQKLSSLPTATHSGSYSFAGWYTAASGGTQITTAYEFSADTTVYAHWTNIGGGGGSYVPKTQKPEIKAAAGGKAELSKDGTTLTITVDAGKVIDKVLLNGKDMGAASELKGLKTGDKVEVIFKDQVTEPTKEELDKAAKEAAGELVLTARSAKLKNGSVKVMFKGDLKAITDAGYTVKYKFYRSTKKSAGYKAVLTKKAPTYYNTYGKKGTMYYYKARVMIYDKDGKFVAQTALKQCKYANRLWTK